MRAQVLQSLHACFQYDSVSFLDEERFKQLLPPLVSQLSAEPPADVLPALNGELDATFMPAASSAGAAPGEQPHVYGQLAVATLVEMAVSSGSDAMWKPLSHQVQAPSPKAKSSAVAHSAVGRYLSVTGAARDVSASVGRVCRC
jgi:U3 small nucleolar RNA-associated protein 10